MKSNDADPAYETLEIGTPLDYTSDIYKVYFEVSDSDNVVHQILSEFVGSARKKNIVRLSHGYEIELPIQCVPDVVRLISLQNIAIYQVIRYAKMSSSWE
jgi:hypothetical protein